MHRDRKEENGGQGPVERREWRGEVLFENPRFARQSSGGHEGNGYLIMRMYFILLNG